MLDHLSITASGLDRAQRFYDATMSALGYSPTCYAAFVPDPDGNRIEAVCRVPEE